MKPRRIKPGKALKVRLSAADLLRFARKIVECEPPPGTRARGKCWEWQSNPDERGYGRFKLNGVQLWAHRLSYAVFRGSIPDGLDVDHVCHNPRCVNPHHLRRRTRAENVAESNRRRATLARTASADIPF